MKTLIMSLTLLSSLVWACGPIRLTTIVLVEARLYAQSQAKLNFKTYPEIFKDNF